MLIHATPGEALMLGHRYEHNATVIEFDISAWIEEFGAGTVRLLCQRPGDAAPYPVTVVRTDRDGALNAASGVLVLWYVSRTDTAQKSKYGKAELRYYSGTEGAEEFLVKSELYKTVVLDALGASLAEAPEEEREWLATLLEAVESIDTNISAAQTAANNAQSAASDAADDANIASAAAIAARAAQSEAEAAAESISGGGTTDYEELSNKPQIDSVALTGNKSAADLGLVPETREINRKPLSADVQLDKSDVGLGNVDNTSDANKPISAATQTALDLKVNVSAVGAANGVAELDANGKVPSAQLPSYVDDVLEYASASEFPATGESGKIYVAVNTNLTYRWSGSGYAEISPSLALGETSATAYRGDRGKTAYDHSQTTGNAHNMTKGDIGLGNVDNTSDANKPVSTATQAALDAKQNKLTVTGAANKGVYVSASGVVSSMNYELNKDVPSNAVFTDTTYTLAQDANDGHKFTFAGSDGSSVTITIPDNNTTYTAATVAPLMDGAAAVGTATAYARADHVHPVDTSRASAVDVAAIAGLLLRAAIDCEAAGNPVTINDAKAANVAALSVAWTPAQSGSGEPAPDNVRPFIGVSSVAVTRTGWNLFDANACVRDDAHYYDGSGAKKASQTTGHTVNYTAVAPETLYTLSGTISVSGAITGVYFYDAGKNWISRTSRTGNAPHSFETPQNCAFVRIQYRSDVLDPATVQLELGTSATEREPYRGQSVEVALVDANNNPLTVYGGRLELSERAATLTVTHGNIASYDGETVPDGWISSTGQLSTGAQVVYPLASPQTYNLTPQQLSTLSGYNNVSASVGTIALTYRADIALALGA